MLTYFSRAMQTLSMRISSQSHLVLKLLLMALAMAGIFVLDTTTSYEVAVAVFYTVVILAAMRVLQRRALIALCLICIVLTVLSIMLTPHGDHRAGLINTGISIAAIVLTTYLAVKMEAARTAAHDAQAQLMRIARVKSLEGLTTSIAHEINQPLAAIVTSGNACQRWLAQTPPNLEKADQALTRILNDAGRASSIISRVRSLARGAPLLKSRFDFNEAVLEVIALSQAELDRNAIQLSTDLQAGLPAALADRVQIQQVLANLVLNAVEAMTPVAAQARKLFIGSRLEGDVIVFSVEDSGVGVPEDAQEQLFEAFWTTKEQGIGVGLSISRTMMEANGGQIWAEPTEVGAIFRFSVPVVLQEKAS